jgi:hypothetical protein
VERVAWDPGWFDFDQSIAVGRADDFDFRREVPECCRGRGLERLMFHNCGRGDPGQIVAARGTITAIWHRELGAIREVDTSGDSYRISLFDGTNLNVDQEETPGRVTDAWAYDESGVPEARRAPGVDDWRMIVEFDAL